jgi:hypothetical protein
MHLNNIEKMLKTNETRFDSAYFTASCGHSAVVDFIGKTSVTTDLGEEW